MAEKKESVLDLTPQRCNMHNKLHHDFFISYRVSKDAATSVKLAAFLDGVQRPDGSNFVTYLDRNCLVPGKNWESGFSYGINNSSTILLLISTGLIETMYDKAKAKGVDNVVKEHKMALALAPNVLIIPIFLSTIETKGREHFTKFNPQRALRIFDKFDHGDPAVAEKMHDVQETLRQVFSFPGVHVQPDCIPEKIPKIVKLWYSKFVEKQQTTDLKGEVKAKVTAWIKYPTQSFRMTIVGAIIGLLPIVTLSLLFMPSKSRKHTDMKRGVAVGNVIGFLVIILVCANLAVKSYNNSYGMQCTQCEAIVMANGVPAAARAYLDIPYMDSYLDSCEDDSNCVVDQSKDPSDSSVEDSVLILDRDCLKCLCSKVYNQCIIGSSEVYVYIVLIACLFMLIIATVLFVSRFTSREAFSMVM